MHEFTCQNIDQSEHDQNHDQAKKKSFKNFFSEVFIEIHKPVSKYVWESLPLSYPHSLYKQTGEGGEYADVITKFTCIDRFPIKYQ